MPIRDLYSKRQKRLRGETPDVYVYNQLPHSLKVQIVQIWRETLGIGEHSSPNSGAAYEYVVTTLRREYGEFRLPAPPSVRPSYSEELVAFFLSVNDVDQALDAIELTFFVIDSATRELQFMGVRNASKVADDAIDELNQRFKEHGVGYQFVNQQIIKVDSELIHSEVVKPALHLLRQEEYAGAEEEFLKAHEHYRHGNAKEAMTEALKAFESVMKTICAKRGWKYDAGATAKKLIAICLDKELIPAFWQNQFAALSTLLESSVPTGRNKLSAHGQGASTTTVPDYLVAYMLHMTASAIVFLVEAEQAMN
jgi:hypothetical protein